MWHSQWHPILTAVNVIDYSIKSYKVQEYILLYMKSVLNPKEKISNIINDLLKKNLFKFFIFFSFSVFHLCTKQRKSFFFYIDKLLWVLTKMKPYLFVLLLNIFIPLQTKYTLFNFFYCYFLDSDIRKCLKNKFYLIPRIE